jgi:molybdopterin-guanine dinucleotide biosynthesis protein A
VAIIAGGGGRRLGVKHKGLISFGQTTLVEHLLSIAPKGPTLLSTNSAEAYEFLDVPLVADLVPERGAPGGVVTVLCLAQTEWVLVMACDMPNVTEVEITRLLAARSDEVDVVCFARAPSFEPLLGVYRASLGRQWLARLDDEPSLRALVDSVRVKALPVFDDTVLDSLNTPAQLAQWLARGNKNT